MSKIAELKEKGYDVSNVFEFKQKIKSGDQVMAQSIRVGKKSDGYTILQALQPLFDLDWSLVVLKGISEPVLVRLHKPGKNGNIGGVHSQAEGSSFSVAMRRMSTGYSSQFSNMQE